MADDRTAIGKIFERQHHITRNITVVYGWAICGVDYGPKGLDGAGMAVLQKMDGRWQVLLSGGGAFGLEHLARIGVPERLWSKLGYREPEEFRRALSIMAAPIWKETCSKAITDKDLALLCRSSWELTLMRNEIYARRGRPFNDPYLRAYFRARPWYQENLQFKETDLSPLESRNAVFILNYQRSHPKP